LSPCTRQVWLAIGPRGSGAFDPVKESAQVTGVVDLHIRDKPTDGADKSREGHQHSGTGFSEGPCHNCLSIAVGFSPRVTYVYFVIFARIFHKFSVHNKIHDIYRFFLLR
jgi:hypothetical protein